MLIDTESAEQDKSFGSSHTRRQVGRSDKSADNSQTNSKRAPVRDDTGPAETKLTSLDVWLSILQSHLGEIRDFGGSVSVSRKAGGGILIDMPDVNICTNHRMMHNGPTCPMC